MSLRDYQQEMLDHATRAARTRESTLLVAPPGTGKSHTASAIMAAIPGTVLIAPRKEIVEQIKARGGEAYTYVKFRNAVQKGQLRPPKNLIVDESHISLGKDQVVGGQLRGLCPGSTRIGLTATPFGGTAERSAKFNEAWPRRHVVLTVAEAVRRGYMQLPKWDCMGLVGDEFLDLSKGQYTVSKVSAALEPELETICNTARDMADDHPTLLVLPSIEVAKTAHRLLGDGAGLVLGSTKDRWAQLEKRLVVTVRVLSEGVDVPQFRSMLDASPTISPVAWYQRVGRITRPGPQGLYLATNLNLATNGYVLDDMAPPAYTGGLKITKPVVAYRRHGIEGLGRIMCLPLETRAGTVWAYNLAKDRRQIMLLVTQKESVYAEREVSGGREKWVRKPVPEHASFVGYRTKATGRQLNFNQLNRLPQLAAYMGLTTRPADLNNRLFDVLICCVQIRWRPQ